MEWRFEGVEAVKEIYLHGASLNDNTTIQITCIDRNGEEVKRVTSADAGTVEDPEGDNTSDNTGGNGGSSDNTGDQLP